MDVGPARLVQPGQAGQACQAVQTFYASSDSSDDADQLLGSMSVTVLAGSRDIGHLWN